MIESFERGGVEYALCGGLAVAIHGHPRATMDIDVLVRADQLSLELLVVGPSLEDPWNGRVVVTWRGRELSIVSRAGLATMKRLAGRPQDLADLAALEGTGDDDSA